MLIELLVVIAIISILVAMHLPSLGAAKNKARYLQFLGNLKQIGTAHFGYPIDNNDYVVFSQYHPESKLFYSFLAPYLIVQNISSTPRPGVYVCPSWSVSNFDVNESGGEKRLPYSACRNNAFGYWDPPMKSSQIKYPSQLMGFFDGYHDAYELLFFGSPQHFSMVHNGRDLSYMDGHAAFYHGQFASSSINKPLWKAIP